MDKTSSPFTLGIPTLEYPEATSSRPTFSTVTMRGQAGHFNRLHSYWLDDDNLVYSATIELISGGITVLLLREGISDVELIRDCAEALATGTVEVIGCFDKGDPNSLPCLTVASWRPSSPNKSL